MAVPQVAIVGRPNVGKSSLLNRLLGESRVLVSPVAGTTRDPVDTVLEHGDKRYLLSPQDLSAADDIPQLIELGIKSFKIEGRLKSPEYVAAVTQVYRKDCSVG